MSAKKRLFLAVILLAGWGSHGYGGWSATPNADAEPQLEDVLLSSEDIPESYTPHSQSPDDTWSTLTTLRDWMFSGGAEVDPPSCTAELSWLVSQLITKDVAEVALWGPQILLEVGVGRGVDSLDVFDSHIGSCKKIRVTSGAVIVDATLKTVTPPKTAAEFARGFQETVTFTLGGFRQTRVVVGMYGSIHDMAALVVGGSHEIDPAAVPEQEIVTTVQDFYERQVTKILRSLPPR